MSSIPQSEQRFLEEYPLSDRLVRALTENVQVYFTRLAESGGGKVHQENGVIWTYTPVEGDEGAIAFQQFDPLHADEQLDAIIDSYRHHLPWRKVLYWSFSSPHPLDLEARLLARGFDWNWRPHWMWLDFHSMRLDHARPPALRVEVVEEVPLWEVSDLPYYNQESSSVRYALTQAHPQHVWHFAAWLNDQVVGHCTLNLTTGDLGLAGLFDVGVIPAARQQGIGTALTLTACQFAQQMGCHHAFLNATEMGESVYRRVGFTSLGYGYTWLLRVRTLAAPPPTKEAVAFAEAIGRGDILTLNTLSKSLPPASFNAPLTSGITLMQIAVSLNQPASARWLVEHGTQLDLLSAWDLGWKEQVPQLLVESPALVNICSGPWQLTPLHVAVERGDTALVRLLLTANPDLELTDCQFHGTALDWAQHFERTEIVELIEQYLAQKKRA